MFKRRAIDGENGETFKIASQRPLDQLCKEALAAKPPNEKGDFLKPDLVDLEGNEGMKFDIRYATDNKSIGAAFAFYGTGPDKEDAIQRIGAPVYGFYGGNDARVNATIPTSTDLMKKAGKTYVPVVYDGAGHGFMRAGEAPDASDANKKAREEAWKRWTSVLKKL